MGSHALAQAQLKFQPQVKMPTGLVLAWFSQDVLCQPDAVRPYLVLQSYWNQKFQQAMDSHVVYGKWLMTLTLQNAPVPRTGQVVQVLIVQSSERAVVSKLTEISMQGGDDIIQQEADRTIKLLLEYVRAEVKPKAPQTVKHTIA